MAEFFRSSRFLIMSLSHNPPRGRRTAWLCLALQFSTLVPLPAVSAGSQVLFASQNTAYILQPGETAESVAQKFALTMEDIRQANAHRDTPVEQLGAGDSIELPLRQNPDVSEQDTRVAQAASDMGRILSAKDVQQSALSRGAGYLSQTVENWLEGSGGKARVKLSLDKHFSQEGNEFDFLYPWYDTPELMTFSQTGIRRVDNRTTLNLGAGQRWFTPSGMLGYNAFFDYDLTRYHYRLGAGVEYARDYLRLGGNGYLGLSKWREAPELTDYEAKPAHGFDLQAQYWLPSLPQLGGKVGYEQYFGKEVALFGVNSRQRNPFALTTGLDYTPFPLLTLSAEHRQGGSGKNDTRLGLGMNYQLGMPWRQQVDPGKVTGSRLLENRRYDLVERNNQIVLQYRKMEVITLSMPASVEGQSGETVTLTPKIFARHGVASLELDDSALVAAGGKVVSQGQGWALTLPVFRPGEKNSYVVSAVAVDKNGNRSERASTVVYVHMTASPSISHSVDKDGALADGKDVNRLTFYFRDAAGNALAGQGVTVKASHGQLMQAAGYSGSGLHTDAEGNLVVHISATRAEPSQVSATMLNSTLSGTVNFVADVATVSLVPDSIKLIRNHAVANGSDSNEVQIKVVDQNNNPVPDVEVRWEVDNGAQFAEGKVKTSAEGVAHGTLTNTLAGEVTIRATLGDASQQIGAEFVNASSEATLMAGNLSVSRDGALADGSDRNVIEALVTDKENNPVAGQTVLFSVSEGAMLVTQRVNSDSKGIAQAEITSLQAKRHQVSAQINGASESVDIRFIANKASARIQAMDVTQNQALANGRAENQLTLNVVDGEGNPLAGQLVKFTATNGAIVKAGEATDVLGTIAIPVTSFTAGNSTVTAEINGSRESREVAFKADAGTATLTAEGMLLIEDGSPANGVQENIAQVKVVDAHNNPLADIDVTFTAPAEVKLASSSVKTNGDGAARVAHTSLKAEQYTVTATLNGHSTSAQSTFIPDATSAVVKEVQPDKTTLPADNSAEVTYTAMVEDSAGAALRNVPVVWKTSLNRLSQQVTRTDDNGKTQVTVKGERAGTATVEAKLNNGMASAWVVAPDVQFLAGDIDSSKSMLTIQPQTILNDGIDEAQLIVNLRDRFDNPITGKAGELQLSHSASPGDIHFGAVTETSVGRYQAAVKGTKEGIWQVSVQLGTGGTLTASLGVVANETRVVKITPPIAVGGKKQATADGHDSITFKVKVTDERDNPVKGLKVRWKSVLGEFSLPVSETDVNGDAQVMLTSRKTGMTTITAQVGSSIAVAGDTVGFITGAINAHSSVTLLPEEILANGRDTARLQIRLTDVSGHVLDGLEGKIAITLQPVTGAEALTGIEKSTVIALGQGLYQVTFKSKQVGQGRIIVKADGVSLSQQPLLRVRADISLVSVRGNIVASSDNELVSNWVKYCATLETDMKQLAGANIPVIWRASPGARLDAGMSTTGEDSKACINLTRDIAGKARVTALVGAKEYVGPETTFNPGMVDEGKSELSIDKRWITANGSDTAIVTLELKDSKGNAVQGLSDNITLSATGVTVGKTAEVKPGGKYLITVNGTRAGNVPLTALLDGKQFKGLLTVELRADASTARITDLKVDPQRIIADGKTQAVYQAVVHDENKNPLENIVVSWFSPEGGDYQVNTLTDKNGATRQGLTTTRAGIYPMEVSVFPLDKKSAPDVTALPASVSIDKSTFTSDKTVIGADGKEFAQLSVHLVDEFDNAIEGEVITLSSSGPGLTLPTGGMDDRGKGNYSAIVTSKTRGVYTLTASVKGTTLKSSINLEVGAITPTLSFANRNQRVAWQSKFTASQKVEGVPAEVVQSWSSSDPAVATVDRDSGKVTLHKAGVAEITVQTGRTATYNTAEASYRLQVDKADPELRFSSDLKRLTWGENATADIPQYTFNHPDAEKELNVEWTSSDPQYVTVDADSKAKDGNAKLLKPGTAIVTAKVAENERFQAGSASWTLDYKKARLPVTFAESLIKKAETDPMARVQSPEGSLPVDVVQKWSSSNSTTLNVDAADGKVSGQKAGQTLITLTIVGNDYYDETSGSYEVKLYGTPRVLLTTAAKAFNKDVSYADWRPFYVGDEISVTWVPKNDDEFHRARHVTIELVDKSTGKILKKIESTLSSGRTIVKAEKDLINKRMFFRATTLGEVGLKIESEGDEIKSSLVQPKEIFSSKRVQLATHAIDANSDVVYICGDWTTLRRDVYANFVANISTQDTPSIFDDLDGELTISFGNNRPSGNPYDGRQVFENQKKGGRHLKFSEAFIGADSSKPWLVSKNCIHDDPLGYVRASLSITYGGTNFSDAVTHTWQPKRPSRNNAKEFQIFN
ncbi:Ig-like domain-containing protein [Enterobacter ludwigii]